MEKPQNNVSIDMLVEKFFRRMGGRLKSLGADRESVHEIVKLVVDSGKTDERKIMAEVFMLITAGRSHVRTLGDFGDKPHGGGKTHRGCPRSDTTRHNPWNVRGRVCGKDTGSFLEEPREG